MAKVSSSSPDLWLLDGVEDFRHYALLLSQKSRRNIAVLTQNLDAAVFAEPALLQSLSTMVRSNRLAQMQILIKDTKPAIATGHPLIRLAQRLSSKIMLRKLVVEPDDQDMGFMLCDTWGLLYKNDDAVYQGFANFAALREAKQLREQFNYCWQYAEPDPDLQPITL